MVTESKPDDKSATTVVAGLVIDSAEVLFRLDGTPRTTSEIIWARAMRLVRDALESPKYKWRTLRGLSSETRLDEKTVRAVVEALGSEVIRSSIASTTGEDLFTTRKHYREKASLLSKLGAALRNRAA